MESFLAKEEGREINVQSVFNGPLGRHFLRRNALDSSFCLSPCSWFSLSWPSSLVSLSGSCPVSSGNPAVCLSGDQLLQLRPEGSQWLLGEALTCFHGECVPPGFFPWVGTQPLRSDKHLMRGDAPSPPRRTFLAHPPEASGPGQAVVPPWLLSVPTSIRTSTT
jgi:hypothetical protein